ncbi:MAG: DUF3843 family protein [Muribaculum sp.]|nr:DUF3843 family protein [Muribaculum sp.]
MAKNKGRDLKNPFEKEEDDSLFNDEIISETMKRSGLDKNNPKDRIQLLRAIQFMKDEYDKDPEGFLNYMESIYDDTDDDGNYLHKELPISETEWTDTHPFLLKCGSDRFYAEVANEILYGFERLNLDPSLPKGVMRTAAKSAAAYLEDIISETGIWHAVRSMYGRRYHKILPFYDVNPEDYYEDDLNIEDLKILMWQAFNRCGGYYDRTFSPLSQGVTKMADIAYDILIDRFEEAKPATRTKDRIKKGFKEGNFFDLRTIAMWLTADCPLTAAPFMRDWMQENAFHTLQYGLKNTKIEGINEETAYYMEEARLGWMPYMSLNGCASNELLAEMADQYGFPELAEKLLTIKEVEFDSYIIEDTKGKNINVRNKIGNTFKVAKDSFRPGVDWNAVKGLACQMYKFGDTYMSNGGTTISEYLPEWASNGSEDSENSEGSEKKLTINADPFIARAKEVVERNRGRRIYYLSSLKDVQDIMGENMKPVAYNPKTEEVSEKEESFDNILLMLSSTNGPILKDDECGIFKDPKNPYYLGRNIPEYMMGGFSFIYHTILPDDVIDYIVGKKLLPNAYMHASQGKRVGKKIVQDNMGFLMRFYRVTCYKHPDDYELPDFDDDDYDENDD